MAGGLRRSWMRVTVYIYVSVVRFTLNFLNSCRKLLSLCQGCTCGNGFCPWKIILYYSVCEDKYRDRCATWGFKHNMKNPPRENWICSYFSRLRAGRIGYRILGEESDFLFQSVQTDSVAHPASCALGNGASSPGVKRPGREADHSI